MNKRRQNTPPKSHYKLLNGTTSAIRTFFTSNRILGENLVLPTLAPKTKRLIGFWLLGCAGFVYMTFGAGGVARMSNYGLSMVNWDMVKRMGMPMGEEEWRREYQKYVDQPDWKYKSSAHVATERELVSFEDFKTVWRAEQLHHLSRAGLFVGFFLPFAAFWYRGMLTRALKIRLGVAGGLLASQVVMDWFLTRTAPTFYDVPRFGQFRLATHLGANYMAYAIFLWTGLSHVLPFSDHSKVSSIGKLRTSLQITALIVFTTIFIGAFMAGTDAGHLMNTWPSYDGKFMPDLNSMMARTPAWKNLYDNPITIQFMHRHWAYFTLIAVAATWWIGRRMPLNSRANFALNTMLAVVVAQAAFGVLTLVNEVPVWLASLHQNGSITLATVVLWLMNEVRRVPK